MAKYMANPVVVDAYVISLVTDPPKPTIAELEAILNQNKNPIRGLLLELEGRVGSEVVATPEMTSRMEPVPVDYWVVQSDGYVYLNPKDVFERKYHRIAEDAAHA